jgi:hypothetical protein
MLAPTLVSPANAGTISQVRPSFQWNSVSGATGYRIQVSDTSDMSHLLSTALVAVTSYTPAASLPRNVTLYWRVRAEGPNGPSRWSARFNFLIQ